MHSIEFTREARKTLKAMPRNLRELVLDKIDCVFQPIVDGISG